MGVQVDNPLEWHERKWQASLATMRARKNQTIEKTEHRASHEAKVIADLDLSSDSSEGHQVKGVEHLSEEPSDNPDESTVKCDEEKSKIEMQKYYITSFWKDYCKIYPNTELPWEKAHRAYCWQCSKVSLSGFVDVSKRIIEQGVGNMFVTRKGVRLPQKEGKGTDTIHSVEASEENISDASHESTSTNNHSADLIVIKSFWNKYYRLPRDESEKLISIDKTFAHYVKVFSRYTNQRHITLAYFVSLSQEAGIATTSATEEFRMVRKSPADRVRFIKSYWDKYYYVPKKNQKSEKLVSMEEAHAHYLKVCEKHSNKLDLRCFIRVSKDAGVNTTGSPEMFKRVQKFQTDNLTRVKLFWEKYYRVVEENEDSMNMVKYQDAYVHYCCTNSRLNRTHFAALTGKIGIKGTAHTKQWKMVRKSNEVATLAKPAVSTDLQTTGSPRRSSDVADGLDTDPNGTNLGVTVKIEDSTGYADEREALVDSVEDELGGPVDLDQIKVEQDEDMVDDDIPSVDDDIPSVDDDIPSVDDDIPSVDEIPGESFSFADTDGDGAADEIDADVEFIITCFWQDLESGCTKADISWIAAHQRFVIMCGDVSRGDFCDTTCKVMLDLGMELTLDGVMTPPVEKQRVDRTSLGVPCDPTNSTVTQQQQQQQQQLQATESPVVEANNSGTTALLVESSFEGNVKTEDLMEVIKPGAAIIPKDKKDVAKMKDLTKINQRLLELKSEGCGSEKYIASFKDLICQNQKEKSSKVENLERKKLIEDTASLKKQNELIEAEILKLKSERRQRPKKLSYNFKQALSQQVDECTKLVAALQTELEALKRDISIPSENVYNDSEYCKFPFANSLHHLLNENIKNDDEATIDVLENKQTTKKVNTKKDNQATIDVLENKQTTKKVSKDSDQTSRRSEEGRDANIVRKSSSDTLQLMHLTQHRGLAHSVRIWGNPELGQDVQVRFRKHFSTVTAPRACINTLKNPKVWYEVRYTRFQSESVVRVGWASSKLPKSTWSTEEGIGDKDDSFGFDPFVGFKYHDGEEAWEKCFEDEGYVGVAFDMHKGEIMFSINGVWKSAFVDVGKWIQAHQTIFPAFSGKDSLLDINFGEKKFRFAPPDDTYIFVERIAKYLLPNYVSDDALNNESTEMVLQRDGQSYEKTFPQDNQTSVNAFKNNELTSKRRLDNAGNDQHNQKNQSANYFPHLKLKIVCGSSKEVSFYPKNDDSQEVRIRFRKDFSTIAALGSCINVLENTKVWYEVSYTRLLNDSRQRVGWASPKLLSCQPDSDYCIGDKDDSFGFDPAWEKSFQNEGYVGVALDMVKGEVMFSVNGLWDVTFSELDKWSQSHPRVVPAFSGKNATLDVNFGSTEFRFGPPDPTFKTVADMLAQDAKDVVVDESCVVHCSKTAVTDGVLKGDGHSSKEVSSDNNQGTEDVSGVVDLTSEVVSMNDRPDKTASAVVDLTSEVVCVDDETTENDSNVADAEIVDLGHDQTKENVPNLVDVTTEVVCVDDEPTMNFSNRVDLTTKVDFVDDQPKETVPNIADAEIFGLVHDHTSENVSVVIDLTSKVVSADDQSLQNVSDVADAESIDIGQDQIEENVSNVDDLTTKVVPADNEPTENVSTVADEKIAGLVYDQTSENVSNIVDSTTKVFSADDWPTGNISNVAEMTKEVVSIDNQPTKNVTDLARKTVAIDDQHVEDISSASGSIAKSKPVADDQTLKRKNEDTVQHADEAKKQRQETPPSVVSLLKLQNQYGPSENVCIWSSPRRVRFREGFNTVATPGASIQISENTKVWYEVRYTRHVRKGLQRIGWASHGLLSSSLSSDTGIGDRNDSFAYDPFLGLKYHDGAAEWVKTVTNKYIGVAIDGTKGEILFSVHGKWASAFCGLETWFKAHQEVMPVFSGRDVILDVNFGENDFNFSPPDSSYETVVDVLCKHSTH